MTCKLYIHNTDPKMNITPFEHAMTGDLLTLGRSKTNDISLDDPLRLVSSHHAEIRHRNLEWHIIDVGSTNGTWLNGKALEGGKEYRLQADDEIQIGKFCIQYIPQFETTQADPLGEHHPVPSPLPPLPSRFERTIASLIRTYRDRRELSESERQPLLVESMRAALQGLDAQESQQFLSLVESHFSTGLPHPNGNLSSPAVPISIPTPSPARASSLPYSEGGIEALLNEYLGQNHDVLTPEDQAELSTRLRKILEMFFEFLHHALQGRRQVEQEFEAEVTRIFSRGRNPVKDAANATALGKSLFQIHGPTEGPETTLQHLQQALEDLSLHHIGMMAGFRESLHGLLMQLDPATLEKEAQAIPIEIGPISIPGKYVPFAAIRNWIYFKHKHHQFWDQDVKTFESVLGPHFSKGYLRVHER